MIRYAFLIGVLFAGAGCSDRRETDLLFSRIDECVERLKSVGISAGGEMSAVSREVRSLGNERLRKNCQKRIEERLLSADIRDLPYARQADYLSFVLRFGYQEDMGRRDGTPLENWGNRLHVLAWLRGELERLQPIEPVDLLTANRATVASYRKWRACYNSAADEYEKTVRWMEQALLPPTLEGMSETDRKALIEHVEHFLGRKIRSAEECERDAVSGKAMAFPPERDMARGPSALVIDADIAAPLPGFNRL